MIFLKIKLTSSQSQFLSAHSVSTFYQSYLSCPPLCCFPRIQAFWYRKQFAHRTTVLTRGEERSETQLTCCAVDDIHGNEAASPCREWGGGLFCNFCQLLNVPAVPHQEHCLSNSLLNASSSHCPSPPATFLTKHTHRKYQRL